MIDKPLRPHMRVTWLSRYNTAFWFKGTVVRVFGDRVLIRSDKDEKLIVMQSWRPTEIVQR
jgi:hypothetical protein